MACGRSWYCRQRLGLFVHFILAEEFFAILNEADEHDHGGSRQADEKHAYKQPHCKKSQYHNHDCSVFPTCMADQQSNCRFKEAPVRRVKLRMDKRRRWGKIGQCTQKSNKEQGIKMPHTPVMAVTERSFRWGRHSSCQHGSEGAYEYSLRAGRHEVAVERGSRS